MYVLWGWRVRKPVVGTGQFTCPGCTSEAPYKLVAPRRWFTLFYLPVIPLDRLDRYVECATCKGTYAESVANVPAAA